MKKLAVIGTVIGLAFSPAYPVKLIELNFYRASKTDKPHHAKKSRGFVGC